MLRELGKALMGYLAEGHLPGIALNKASKLLTRDPELGYERRPSFRYLVDHNTPAPLPVIKSGRAIEMKIERHDAHRAGSHLDLRFRIGNRVYDFAVVKRTGLPNKTGIVSRVQRTPNHSLRYFYKDKAVFGPGTYGAGSMQTAWRGRVFLHSSSPSRMEFSIPEGIFQGRYCIRELSDGFVILRMKEPKLHWQERMEYTAQEKKLEQIYTEPNIIAEEKIDGANFMIIPGEKENQIISRRMGVDGKPINRADNMPQIKYHRFPKELWGKVIHGEVVAYNKSSSYTAGLLNSLPNRSIAVQLGQSAPLRIHLWDIGTGDDYASRRDLLRSIVKSSPRIDNRSEGNQRDKFWFRRLSNPRVFELPVSNIDRKLSAREFSEKIKASGKEGTVIKRLDRKYYQDEWVKNKKVETYDMKVIGFQEGTGKYKGSLGALIVEDPRTGAISKVGGGMSDYQRNWIYSNQDLVKNKMIQAACLELTDNGIMRAPRFVSFHPEAGVQIVDEQSLLDYSEATGSNIYSLKASRGWRKGGKK